MNSNQMNKIRVIPPTLGPITDCCKSYSEKHSTLAWFIRRTSSSKWWKNYSLSPLFSSPRLSPPAFRATSFSELFGTHIFCKTEIYPCQCFWCTRLYITPYETHIAHEFEMICFLGQRQCTGYSGVLASAGTTCSLIDHFRPADQNHRIGFILYLRNFRIKHIQFNSLRLSRICRYG